MDRRYLVLDIETIPDWDLIRQVFSLDTSAKTEDLQEAILNKYKSTFAPPPFHIPICIALIDVDFDTYEIKNAAVLENEEKTLLQHFWKTVRQRKGNTPVATVLVHFNGRGFDLPVLMYRSMKYRIPVSPWDRGRYSSASTPPRKEVASSHDVCDDLSDFGAASRPSLNVIAKLLGLPGKTDVDGSQIEDLFLRGEKNRIKDYCMEDALTTYRVWLTMKMVRGEIPEERYRVCFDGAAEQVRKCRTATDSFSSNP